MVMLTRAIGNPRIPRSSAALDNALFKALSSVCEKEICRAFWKLANPLFVTSEPAILIFIYGDFISLFELRVKAKSLIPARGRRTSNIEDVLGEDVIV